MSQTTAMRGRCAFLSRSSLAALLVVGLLGFSGRIEAQGRVRPAKMATRANAVKAKPLPVAGIAAAAKFRPANVSTTLKASLRGKALMVAPKKRTAEYERVMKNSIEIVFEPQASRQGHLLVRVGDRIYDMPGPTGARNQRFSHAMQFVNSAAYGFVYARTATQVASLQREFDAMASAGHGFAMAGAGPSKFSCASFVTTVLAKHAPELQVGLSVGAISAARNLLRYGKHDAVTLYGKASREAARENFEFLKLH